MLGHLQWGAAISSRTPRSWVRNLVSSVPSGLLLLATASNWSARVLTLRAVSSTTRGAGFAVFHQHRHCHSTGWRLTPVLYCLLLVLVALLCLRLLLHLFFVFLLAFTLVAMVLEPDFYLKYKPKGYTLILVKVTLKYIGTNVIRFFKPKLSIWNLRFNFFKNLNNFSKLNSYLNLKFNWYISY